MTQSVLSGLANKQTNNSSKNGHEQWKKQQRKALKGLYELGKLAQSHLKKTSLSSWKENMKK